MRTVGDSGKSSADRIKANEELVAGVHETLQGFSADRKRGSKEQAEALADFMAQLREDVSGMIKTFKNDRKAMAGALKESLESEKTDRLKGERDRLETAEDEKTDRLKAVEDIETYVKNMLKEFSEAHADMSEQLRQELAGYRANIAGEVEELLSGFADEGGKRRPKEETRKQTPTVKATGKDEKVLKQTPTVKATGKDKKVAPEMSLGDQIVKFIEEHPNGVRVSEMEDPLESTRMQLGRTAKGLLEEGKLRKEKSYYYPA